MNPHSVSPSISGRSITGRSISGCDKNGLQITGSGIKDVTRVKNSVLEDACYGKVLPEIPKSPGSRYPDFHRATDSGLQDVLQTTDCGTQGVQRVRGSVPENDYYGAALPEIPKSASFGFLDNNRVTGSGPHQEVLRVTDSEVQGIQRVSGSLLDDVYNSNSLSEIPESSDSEYPDFNRVTDSGLQDVLQVSGSVAQDVQTISRSALDDVYYGKVLFEIPEVPDFGYPDFNRVTDSGVQDVLEVSGSVAQDVQRARESELDDVYYGKVLPQIWDNILDNPPSSPLPNYLERSEILHLPDLDHLAEDPDVIRGTFSSHMQNPPYSSHLNSGHPVTLPLNSRTHTIWSTDSRSPKPIPQSPRIVSFSSTPSDTIRSPSQDHLDAIHPASPGYPDAVLPRLVTQSLGFSDPDVSLRRYFDSMTDPILDHVNHSVISDVLSEVTDEDVSSLYSVSSRSASTMSFSTSSSRTGSGKRREETRRQRYWNYTQPGLTVDELARHRRKRPPSSQIPKDHLKLLDGDFGHLKTEYKRRYSRVKRDKFKSEDKVENQEVGQTVSQREKLLRRPTSLRLEGSVESTTEFREKFKFEEAERSPLVKPEVSLKPEGEIEVRVSENHEKYVEFPGAKRPELLRKPTSLKLEGGVECATEVGENFVQHPPQPLEKPIIHGDELSSVNSPMAHEVTTEYRPEYKENYIAFEAKRNVAMRPEGTLKPEGTMTGSTELKSEYKDFHPSRPVLQRNNSMLKPSGDFGGDSEKQSEFKDFHPARPTIHRNNSLLRPSGEFEKSTEKGSEYKDFHVGRPVLQRNNSQLKPSGDMAKTSEVRAEYKNFSPKRPVIHRVDSKLKPEGDMAKTSEGKAEYRDFHPSRPVIHRMPSNLAMEGRMEKETEIRAEYRDFHPSRPVIYRKNSMLKPEGDIEASQESREYRDFHPSRPTIHRNNSLLKPEGEIGKDTEARTEYRDFHPGRPVIHRKNSMLHPEGDIGKDTEARTEYRDFHPGRPVIHRKNSMLHPEGDIGKDTEARTEYRDFHPGRPVIHRKNSMLHPEGEIGKDTEASTEYRDFHPGRPVLHRNNSLLHPEGETGKSTEAGTEYRDFHPGRPTIYTENCNLKPGNRIEERSRALTPKKGEYYVLEGEITIRPDKSAKALENIKNEERSSTAGRRLPGTSTLPRSRAARSLLPEDTPTGDRSGFRFTVENVDDNNKAFVVIDDNNNNNANYEDLPEFQNRWLRGSLRDRAEPWRPSWALNPNTKDVPNS